MRAHGALAIMGWLSQSTASRSSVSWRRISMMEYIIMAPADGARDAACSTASRCSSVTGVLGAKARVELRSSISCRTDWFHGVPGAVMMPP